jgi:hypothetical protein
MTKTISDLPTAAPPSLRQLARTTAIALAVAAILLVTIVLPAEYAIDPLGTGRRLGLTEIAAPRVNPVEAMRPPGEALKPLVKGPFGEYSAEFKVDVYDVTLQPYEYVEYKYHLEQGATMVFWWHASAPMLQDFHGEREGTPPVEGRAEESYDKQDRQQSSGSLTAPFAGIHGWYWENPGATPITIHLTSSGFYGAAVEIRSDRSRHPRTLKSLSTLSTAAPMGDSIR